MYEIGLLSGFVLLGLIGYACRSPFAKSIFLIASVVCLSGFAAWETYTSIDLSACRGSFIPMITCPASVEASRDFKLARFSFGAWFYTTLILVLVVLPLMIVAAVIEIKKRLALQKG